MFQLGNHDRSRVASNVGAEYVDVMTLLLLLLPGTPTVYQGDEIGMRDVDVSWEQTQDPKALFYGKVRSDNDLLLFSCIVVIVHSLYQPLSHYGVDTW